MISAFLLFKTGEGIGVLIIAGVGGLVTWGTGVGGRIIWIPMNSFHAFLHIFSRLDMEGHMILVFPLSYAQSSSDSFLRCGRDIRYHSSGSSFAVMKILVCFIHFMPPCTPSELVIVREPKKLLDREGTRLHIIDENSLLAIIPIDPYLTRCIPGHPFVKIQSLSIGVDNVRLAHSGATPETQNAYITYKWTTVHCCYFLESL